MSDGKRKKVIACALSFLFAALIFSAAPVRADDVVHIEIKKGMYHVCFQNGQYSGEYTIYCFYSFTMGPFDNFIDFEAYSCSVITEPDTYYEVPLLGLEVRTPACLQVTVISTGSGETRTLGRDTYTDTTDSSVIIPTVTINAPEISGYNLALFTWSVTPGDAPTSYQLKETASEVSSGQGKSVSYRLRVGVEYTLNVTATYPDHGLTKSVTSTINYTLPASAGPALTLEDVSTSAKAQVRVSWAAAAGATYKVLKNNADVTASIANGAVDTDVKFGQTYTYAVYLVLPETGDLSAPSTKSISLSQPAVPGKPTGLAAAEVTSTTVRLTWNTAANAASYRVYWDRGEGTQQQSIDVAAAAATVTGLTPNTDYRFFVSALSAAVESEKSSPLTAKTKTATKPAKPTGLALVSAARDSLTVSWDSASDVTSWTVSYTREGKTLTVESTSAHAKLEGLEPDTEYSVTVTAQNASGKSDPSDPVVMKTKEESEDGEQELVIEFGDATDTVIPLRWNAVEGAVSYRVTRSKGVRDPFEEAAMTEATYWDDTELEPGTTYFYVVEALDEDGAVFLRSSPAVCDTLAKTPVILPDSGRQSVAGLSLKRLLPFYALFILLMMGLLFVLQMKRKRDER